MSNVANACLLVLLIAGHSQLLVSIVNRLHANPWSERVLIPARRLHDALLVIFPLLVIGLLGLRGPRLLLGGSWSEVSAGWAVYLGICSVGVALLLSGIVRYQLTRRPVVVTANHSRLVDVQSVLGHKPLASGLYRRMATLPFNGQFQIEVNQRTLRLPRTPVAWQGLRLLHLSDWHLEGVVGKGFFTLATELARAEKPDLILFTGDLLENRERLEWVAETLGSLMAPLGCWYILGNHDWYEGAAAIRATLDQHGWRDVSSRVEVIHHAGHSLAIGGDETPWMGTPPDFSSAPQDAFRLLLSHTPDNIARAKRDKVDLMLSGHNHGGQVVLPILGPVYAPSRYGAKYAGGLFWENPTLLCVSRGLSGRHPLRWRCPPEITTYVLCLLPHGPD